MPGGRPSVPKALLELRDLNTAMISCMETSFGQILEPSLDLREGDLDWGLDQEWNYDGSFAHTAKIKSGIGDTRSKVTTSEKDTTTHRVKRRVLKIRHGMSANHFKSGFAK